MDISVVGILALGLLVFFLLWRSAAKALDEEKARADSLDRFVKDRDTLANDDDVDGVLNDIVRDEIKR